MLRWWLHAAVYDGAIGLAQATLRGEGRLYPRRHQKGLANRHDRTSGLRMRSPGPVADEHALAIVACRAAATALLGCASILALTAQARAQPLLPQGGTVASGQVRIGTPSGNSLTINQTSAKAVVDWTSFSVGAGASVSFVQPNAGSAILNRVTGATSSTIAGQITGNGQVFLVNPNGIAITPTGSVQVGGGFVASTLDISNAYFTAGRLSFPAKARQARSVTLAPFPRRQDRSSA